LGHFYGLNGILVGVLVSQIVIVRCWKTYFLFHNGLKGYAGRFLKTYGVHLVVLAGAAALSSWLIGLLRLNLSGSWLGLIGGAVLIVGIFALLLLAGMVLCRLGIRSSIRRFVKRSNHA